MLIIFESTDKTGKTELAKKLAESLSFTYMKLKNIEIEDDIQIKDNVSISTRSQLETFLQLYENGVLGNVILDRFHISEYVYSNVFGRSHNIDYVFDIEKRLAKLNDVFVVKAEVDLKTLNHRWKDEKLLDKTLINKIDFYYDYYFRVYSRINMIKIDSSQSIEITLGSLLRELQIRGVYKNHPRSRRIGHDETMMQIAKTIAKRSPDISRQVGAVLTENGFIVGVGYNGPPSGLAHDEIDIRKVKGYKSGEGLDLSRSIHAEQNAIMQSGLRSKSQGNLELFCTTSPCIHCTRMLLQIGINKITFLEKYNDELAESMWEEAGIKVIQWKTRGGLI